jgi:hypothetical protein
MKCRPPRGRWRAWDPHPHMTGRASELRERALTGALALCLVPAALWGVPVVILLVAIAAQPPDELQPDGDPCCPVPDTWGRSCASRPSRCSP